MSESQGHWDGVYLRQPDDAVSWFEAEPVTSVRLIDAVAGPTASVVDAGGGASRLVDRFLEAGYADLTVVDISAAALGRVRDRLPETSAVRLIRADLLDWEPGRVFDVWHDRAVFHFLVDPAARRGYTALVARSVSVGGALVIASFGPQGPTTCSGLPTARYDAVGLGDVWGDWFDLEHAEQEDHPTPSGTVQQLTWAVLRRRTPTRAR